MKETTIIHNLRDMQTLAQSLSQNLQGGERIGLIGPLGAGKTTFVQFLAATLGVKEPVDSPSFVLRQAFPVYGHPIIRELVHLDLYRLGENVSLNQLTELGLADDWGQPDSVIVIEWAGVSQGLVNELSFVLDFTWQPETDRRSVHIQKSEG